MGAWGLQERMFLEVPCKQESSTKAFVPIMAMGAKPQLCLGPEPAGFLQDSGCCVHTRALSTTSEAGAGLQSTVQVPQAPLQPVCLCEEEAAPRPVQKGRQGNS